MPPSTVSERHSRPGARRPGEAHRLAWLLASALAHVAFLAALLLWPDRDPPREPAASPADYALVFEGDAESRPGTPEGTPGTAADSPVAPGAPPPAQSPPMPQEDIPPVPLPRLAEIPRPPPSLAPPLPTPPAPLVPPPDPVFEALLNLPPPPPPLIPRPSFRIEPERQAALATPPVPIPPRTQNTPLAGVWIPGAASLAPSARPTAQSRPGTPGRMDLTLPVDSPLGRSEAEIEVDDPNVGADWLNAFSRWWINNRRYPRAAADLGQQGTARLELLIEPNGHVRTARLIRSSGSVWIDSGIVNFFNGNTLPPFPRGVSPDGVTFRIAVKHILIR